ncbi:MAG: SDR family NAD(P)-dependent oxidoreductase [Nitrospiraceae bacterium]
MPHSSRSNADVAGHSSRAMMPPTILVTGGSRGIGRAVCVAFGAAGWRVGVHYREQKWAAEHTAAAINQSGGQAVVCQADIRDPDQARTMIEGRVAQWGRLDVLVANAGVASSRLLLRLSPNEWDAVMATNLTGTFHCVKAAGAYMLARREGSVLVIGSFAGFQGQPGQSAYAASKAGLLGLVKALAIEWGPHNVRVNAVLPGRHKTGMTENARQDGSDLEGHTLGRSPNLEDVAKMIYHLALLQNVSGQVWNLDSRIL